MSSLLSIRSIWSLLFFLFFLFSFIHSRSWQNSQALDSTLIFIIYSSQTRLHRRIIKQNSQLDHTKGLYSTRSKYYQKDRTKKNGTDKSDGDMIPGHSPKLGRCQGECPYPMLNSCLLVKKMLVMMTIVPPAFSYCNWEERSPPLNHRPPILDSRSCHINLLCFSIENEKE